MKTNKMIALMIFAGSIGAATICQQPQTAYAFSWSDIFGSSDWTAVTSDTNSGSTIKDSGTTIITDDDANKYNNNGNKDGHINEAGINSNNTTTYDKALESMKQESYNTVGLNGVDSSLQEKLFTINTDSIKDTLSKMSEEQKEQIYKSQTTYAVSLEPSQLAKDVASVLGNDPNLWGKVMSSYNCKSEADVRAMLGSVKNDLQEYSNLAKSIQDAINTSGNGGSTKGMTIVQGELADLIGAKGGVLDKNGGNLGNGSGSGNIYMSTELLNKLQEISRKLGISEGDLIKILQSDKNINIIPLVQRSETSDGKLEKLDKFNIETFPYITRVEFTITSKEGGVPPLSINQARTLAIQSKYNSTFTNWYEKFTGSKIPYMQVQGNKVILDYSKKPDGTSFTWDELRGKTNIKNGVHENPIFKAGVTAPKELNEHFMYKNEVPAVSVDIPQSPSANYTVQAKVYGKIITERDDKFAYFTTKPIYKKDENGCIAYDEITGKPIKIGKDWLPHDISFWPYAEQPVKVGNKDKNTEGSNKLVQNLTNKKPYQLSDEIYMYGITWTVGVVADPHDGSKTPGIDIPVETPGTVTQSQYITD